MKWHACFYDRQTSNIKRTKSQNLNVSCLVLLLFFVENEDVIGAVINNFLSTKVRLILEFWRYFYLATEICMQFGLSYHWHLILRPVTNYEHFYPPPPPPHSWYLVYIYLMSFCMIGIYHMAMMTGISQKWINTIIIR